MRKSGSCMLRGSAPLSNGNQVLYFQINMVNNISIKGGRNNAVVKESVVNALEAEIVGCIIVQLSSNAFV